MKLHVLCGVAGSNFTSGEDDKKAANFKGTSFGYSGDKVVSQRDIQRLVRSLLAGKTATFT